MTTLRTSAPFRGARRMLVSPGSLAPSMSSIALVLALLLWPRAVQGDVIDDYGTVSGRAPSRSAASTGRRIMVVGDSIQSGTGLVSVTSQASWRLQRYGGIIVHNFASPGATMADTFFPGMNHATTAVQLLHGFFGLYGVVVALGINDWGQSIPVSDFSSAYGTFLDGIPSTVKVACMSPVWTTSESALNAHGEHEGRLPSGGPCGLRCARSDLPRGEGRHSQQRRVLRRRGPPQRPRPQDDGQISAAATSCPRLDSVTSQKDGDAMLRPIRHHERSPMTRWLLSVLSMRTTVGRSTPRHWRR